MPDGTVTHEVKTTCPYCGVGCGVVVKTERQHNTISIVEVRGDTAHPANYGRLCSKGSKLMETARPEIYSQVRATEPLMRSDRAATPQPVQWSEALNAASGRFADLIQKYGPDSVAFYISGQLLTEDYYVFNKLAKGLIGTNNVDTNSRLCMSSAVSGYKRSLGADAPPCCYEDIEQAECVFIAGSNMAYAHPVLFRRLEAARESNPNHKLIVVDPRRTDTAKLADLHLQILPGTDVMLFNAMLAVMVQDGLLDGAYVSQHTEGFNELVAGLAECAPEVAAQVCGISKADLVQAAQWFAQSPATLSLYCQGLNQATTGTDKNTSLINLHLASGQ
ncbi:MAG: molybdopterin-dependent oxidoreductase, partial [Limnobacter sp.]|nr:molybdopterin-dependent oxidoreductase [Limnobacter sp.]